MVLSSPLIKPLSNTPRIIYIHSLSSSSVFSKEFSSGSLMENIYYISYIRLYEHLFQLIHKEAILTSLVITGAHCWADRIRDLYPDTRPLVIHPPVNVDKFSFLAKVPRNEKNVLTIARINPSKQLHEVILLSKLMPSEYKFIIAGYLTEQYVPYYNELNKLIKQLNLRDRVRILTNVSGKQLLDLMRKSSIFFFTTSLEGFAIVKVDAMAAGLIPVVPDLCRINEGVPREYVYKNLEEAARIIEENINAPIHKRVELSKYAERFSKQTFKAKLKLVISKVLDLRGYDS